MGTDHDDDSHDEERHRRDRKRKRKRHHRDVDTDESSTGTDDSSSSSTSIEDDDDHPDRRHQPKHANDKKKKRRHEKNDDEYKRDKKQKKKKRNKKEKKKDKRKKRHKEKRRQHGENEEKQPHVVLSSLERNYRLADALYEAMEQFPDLYEDLSVILIRLASGAQLDLSQSQAQSALSNILQELQEFGVVSIATTTPGAIVWKWNAPTTITGRSNPDERVLIRVVRALLDQIGLDMNAIETYEKQPKPQHQLPRNINLQQHVQQQSDSAEKNVNSTTSTKEPLDKVIHAPIHQETSQLLQKYHQGQELSKDLVALCQLILDGECIALDGLPDPELRKDLELLLQHCGLVKVEMETDDEDDNNDDQNNNQQEPKEIQDGQPVMGYSLPEEDGQAPAIEKLQVIVQVCSINNPSQQQQPPIRRVKGPMLDPSAYENFDNNDNRDDSSVEDEGPLPFGSQRQHMVSSEAFVQVSAARTAQELACAKQGIPVGPDTTVGGREEWMLVPGKFDFLNAIKSGPQRSRQFQNKKSSQAHVDDRPISDSVRAEIMALRQAHEEARGPSLMEQHREALAKKERDKDGSDSTWKWNREQDLDAGRRVDKDALKMILGGAGKDLKTKFHSSM